MWDKLLRYAQDIFHLKQRTDTNSEDIEKLQKQVEQLSLTVERLSMEFQHLKETERNEREKLVLKLQLIIERMERRKSGLSTGEDQNLLE
jgi:archaellum component FlaC